MILLLTFYAGILVSYLRSRDEPNEPPGPVFWIVNGVIVIFLISAGLSSSGNGSRTDGVFESATKN